MNQQAFSALASLRLALPLALLLALVLPASAAEEVCVTCSGPSAIYRCTVDEASKVQGHRYGKRVLQLACITELAKAGGHEQCRVERTGPDTCFGFQRSIRLTDSLEALATRAETEAVGDTIGAPQTHVIEKSKKSGPPKTVEELARRTAQSSKQQLKNTGKAVKKGWSCLMSLFQDC